MGRLRGVPRLKTAVAVICVLLLCCSCVETTTWIGAAATKPDATAGSGAPPVSLDAGSAAEEPPWRCALPVPGTRTLETPVWGTRYVPFYVPDSRWALASVHASMMLEDLEDWRLRLPPSFFLSSALVSSFLGCSDDMPEHPTEPGWGYARRPETDPSGCLGLTESQLWTELCRGFPAELDCTPEGYRDAISSLDQATTGRDNVASGMVAMSMYLTMAYAMTALHDVMDPDAFFASQADPLAEVKWAALTQLESPWSGAMATALGECPTGAFEACITEGSSGRVRMETVASLVEELGASVFAGDCFDGPLSAQHVDAHVDTLAALLVDTDMEPARAAAQAALEEARREGADTFQLAGPEVLEALHGALDWRLRCPGAGLQHHYGLTCPP